jgi:hypothetical protein
MTQTEKQPGAKMPKGGRKGGVLFPKLDLKRALNYSKKLVAKTHTGPQPEKTILPGVFGSPGSRGKIRASSLKQYGLLEGGVEAYKATQLAKGIEAALDADRPELLQRAFLNSKLFNQIFQTFHGDKVSKAQIEKRAKGLEVHPESAEECAQLFMSSAVTAGLGTIDGDSISLAKSGETAPATESATGEDGGEEIEEQDNGASGEAGTAEAASIESNGRDAGPDKAAPSGAKPGVALNLTVDPSSDPDKLEKQLKLLRQFGLI